MEFPPEPRIVRVASEHGRLAMAVCAPAAPLRDLVRRYCVYDETRALRSVHQHLPHRDVTLIVSLGGTLEVRDPSGDRRRFGEGRGFLAGLHSAPALTDATPQQRGVQVSLTPLGAHRLLGGLPMGAVTNRALPLDDLLGRGAGALAARLAETRGWREPFAVLDAFFAERLLRSGNEVPAGVVLAWRRLHESHGGVRIGALTAQLGWSRKRLVAAFREHVGLPPKAVARVLRFDRAVRLLKERPGTSFVEIALACGYHDQAHAAREVRELSGSTPRELARLLLPSGDLTTAA